MEFEQLKLDLATVGIELDGDDIVESFVDPLSFIPQVKINNRLLVNLEKIADCKMLGKSIREAILIL